MHKSIYMYTQRVACIPFSQNAVPEKVVTQSKDQVPTPNIMGI